MIETTHGFLEDTTLVRAADGKWWRVFLILDACFYAFCCDHQQQQRANEQVVITQGQSVQVLNAQRQEVL